MWQKAEDALDCSPKEQVLMSLWTAPPIDRHCLQDIVHQNHKICSAKAIKRLKMLHAGGGPYRHVCSRNHVVQQDRDPAQTCPLIADSCPSSFFLAVWHPVMCFCSHVSSLSGVIPIHIHVYDALSQSQFFGSHMEGLASSCCLLEPSECSSFAKASLVGARKVAVM